MLSEVVHFVKVIRQCNKSQQIYYSMTLYSLELRQVHEEYDLFLDGAVAKALKLLDVVLNELGTFFGQQSYHHNGFVHVEGLRKYQSC